VSRATQSLAFAVIYSIYCVAVMGPVQWLAVRPLAALLPGRRAEILRAWLHGQARWVLWLARSVGGMRLTIQGELPRSGCVVVVNHQSLLDIPIAVALVRGPAPLIPMRASYARGIPGISMLMRMGGHPLLRQGARATRDEHRALAAAAERVAAGERSLVLFPEGHRSRDGELQPFMTPGLERILRRARAVPVYVVAVDGLWGLRTFGDIALRLAATRARVAVRGPFAIPSDERQHGVFIERLHDEMLAALRELRGVADERAAPPASRVHARLAGQGSGRS
jgi:1-acyl-sn-glycerol-3-phosphate acyltransferase